MAIEDHPKYPQWREARDRLIQVREALRRGDVRQAEVDEAQAEYDRLSRAIDIA